MGVVPRLSTAVTGTATARLVSIATRPSAKRPATSCWSGFGMST